jgi:hypothetical protein
MPEIRYYTRAIDKTIDQYISFQVLNKYAVKNYEEWAQKLNSSGIDYLQLTPVRQTKYVIAPHFMVGWHFFLDYRKRVSFDFNMGLGVRLRYIHKSIDNNVRRDFLNLNDDSNQQTISFASNLKLCFFIK